MAKIESMAPSGAPYVDGDEREGYMGRAMLITHVTHEPNARFGPRWVVEVAMLDSGEAIALGLASNAYRDRQLGAVASLLADGGDVDPVVLYRDEAHNNSWAFRSAEDAEIEAAGKLAGEDDAEPEPAPTKKGK